MSHYVILSTCDTCLDMACVDVCPMDCIHGPSEARRGEPRRGLQLFVNPDECIDCGACEPECPVHAIVHESDVPPQHAADIARNAAFFEERTRSE